MDVECLVCPGPVDSEEGDLTASLIQAQQPYYYFDSDKEEEKQPEKDMDTQRKWISENDMPPGFVGEFFV